MAFSKQAGMLQMDFSLQKKSKIPKSYKSHRTKLLSSDQLQLKERNKTKSHKKTPNQPMKKNNPHQKASSPSKPPKPSLLKTLLKSI